MDVIDTIHARRAVRDYKPEPVPPDLLRAVTTAASWAPSAMNQQPWRFTVVTDRGRLEEIADKAKHWAAARLAGQTEAPHLAEMLSNPSFHIFYNAPALVVISAPSKDAFCIADCALAAQNLMLAASRLGLGSCWTGMAEAWLNSEAGHKALHLPAGEQVVAPIILGFPQSVPAPVPRKPPTLYWIGDSTAPMPEGHEAPQPHAGGGLFTGLLHS